METNDILNGSPYGLIGKDIGKFFAALAAAQGELEGVKKDALNEHPKIKKKYSTLESCFEACRAALSKNEIGISQPTRIIDGKEVLTTLLVHSSGNGVYGELPLTPMKQKTGEGWVSSEDPQTKGSDITYKRRYLLCAMVGLAPEDDDGNKATEDYKKRHASEGLPGSKANNKKTNGGRSPSSQKANTPNGHGSKPKDETREKTGPCDDADKKLFVDSFNFMGWKTKDAFMVMNNEFSCSSVVGMDREKFNDLMEIIQAGPEKWEEVNAREGAMV